MESSISTPGSNIKQEQLLTPPHQPLHQDDPSSSPSMLDNLTPDELISSEKFVDNLAERDLRSGNMYVHISVRPDNKSHHRRIATTLPVLQRKLQRKGPYHHAILQQSKDTRCPSSTHLTTPPQTGKKKAWLENMYKENGIDLSNFLAWIRLIAERQINKVITIILQGPTGTGKSLTLTLDSLFGNSTQES